MKGPERTVLWSAESVQPNNTSIVLNDSIDNYDELIYLGSGTRTYCPCVMSEYPVISGVLNLGGPFFFGNWGATDGFVLCNGTQVFVSGNSGFVGSSYYWGKNNSDTAYAASLVVNRTNDVRPYQIIGVKYPNNFDRTLIWSSDHTQQLYETNIQLSEPVTHFGEIMVLGSGFENAGVGCRHSSKNIYNVQPLKIMGCDAWAYTPWKLAEKHNLVIGQELRLSGNSGHIGSGYYMGMGNQTTAWAAGKWNADYQFSATAPYQIFGLNHKPVRKLTILPSIHGSMSASVLTGCEYDEVTLSNTPDEDWYFSGYNITGATLTGNKFVFGDSDVTVQAAFTDEGFPIVYESDDHCSLTGDKTIVAPGETVTLTTGYDTYYRISGYDVTGGTVEGNTLTVTAPCTIRAVSKPNAFTASGTFEQRNTNIGAYAGRDEDRTANVPQMYAITSFHTSNVPATWYSTSNRWNPTNPSNYSITLKPVLWTSGSTAAYAGQPSTGSVTGKTLAGSTALHTASYDGKIGKKSYAPTVTSDKYNCTYGLSGKIWAKSINWGGYYTSVSVYNRSAFTTGTQNGTWTATGYAP